MTRRRIPIACTLSPADMTSQAAEWAELRERAQRITRVSNGVEMTFPAELADTVEDLAAREATCCAFLTITTTRGSDEIGVWITSADPDGRPVAELLAGF